MLNKFLIYAIFLLICCANKANAQGTNVTFGKNRVQYHKNFKEWSQYESENFITYWYGESRNIGQSVVLIAEHELSDVTNLLEYIPSDKIEIIVYTDITDLKQTNIGAEEAFENKGIGTKVSGNKIFIISMAITMI